MGTKNQPGEFDCYAKADPDEPVFVLLGRDPVASLVVNAWALVREKLLDAASPDLGADQRQVDEAKECSVRMLDWAWRKLGKRGKVERASAAFKQVMAAGRRARQINVLGWVRSTFGELNAAPPIRAARLLEEAAELAQAEGIAEGEVGKIVRHVYGRDPGDGAKEAGAVAVCLLAYCESRGISADEVEQAELERVLAKDPEAHRASEARKKAAGLP